MNIIHLNPSLYCLYMKDQKGKEKLFLEINRKSGTVSRQIHLFSSENAAHQWIKGEKAIQSQSERWNMHAIYERLYPKQLFITEFEQLMRKNAEITSITITEENWVRRLYFKDDLENDYHTFPVPNQKIFAKEPIYMINRQRKLTEKVTLHRDPYFVTYPLVAIPLFTVGIIEWAEDLLSRIPEQGYVIEQTTLYDIYVRTKLEPQSPKLFILSREHAPHYILRQENLKNIVEGTVDYL